MKMHADDGPPCQMMEGLIQKLADGSLRGPMRWFAAAHAARCSRCGSFLSRLQVTISALRAAKGSAGATHTEALERLRQQVRDLESKTP